MVFYHPKYYKELRTRNKSDQAISHSASTEANSRRAPSPESDQVISPLAKPVAGRRAPGPGLKLPGPRPISNANKGLIHRRQASSAKLKDPQATSDKHQAPRHKRQA